MNQDNSNGSGDVGGRVVVATRVIEKTAAQVAAEMSGVAGQGRGFLGIGKHADNSVRPKVTARVSGDSAALNVELALGFPARIDSTTRAVQRELAARVTQLTGVSVSRVDVEVVALLVDDGPVSDRDAVRTVR